MYIKNVVCAWVAHSHLCLFERIYRWYHLFFRSYSILDSSSIDYNHLNYYYCENKLTQTWKVNINQQQKSKNFFPWIHFQTLSIRFFSSFAMLHATLFFLLFFVFDKAFSCSAFYLFVCCRCRHFFDEIYEKLYVDSTIGYIKSRKKLWDLRIKRKDAWNAWKEVRG